MTQNILAIRFARLGDVILLLPALAAIKRSLPDARLTLLTGHRCAPVAQMCTWLDEVISVDRIAMRDGPKRRAVRDVSRLIRDIRSRRFDAVIDFHSFRETNILTWLSGSPLRMGMRRFDSPFLGYCFNQPPVDEDKSLHVSEMFQRVAQAVPGVHAVSTSESTLKIPESVCDWVESALHPGPRLALYVDAPAADRRWPAASFAAIADHAVERFQAGCVILSGPANAAAAAQAFAACRFPEKVQVFSDLKLPQLAGVIRSSRLLISNDTGPMHLGPALGVPTLGLFSAGLPEHFRPIGERSRFLKNQPIEGISAGQVIEELDQMWLTADRDLRR